MSDYTSSPQVNGKPLSPDRTEIFALQSVVFGTGAINTATIYGVGDYEKRVVFVDITAACTGGMSAPHTISVAARCNSFSAWTTLQSWSYSSTAYMFNINPTGSTLTGLWQPLENLKFVITNPNTGTSTNLNVTSTVKMAVTFKK